MNLWAVGRTCHKSVSCTQPTQQSGGRHITGTINISCRLAQVGFCCVLKLMIVASANGDKPLTLIEPLFPEIQAMMIVFYQPRTIPYFNTIETFDIFKSPLWSIGTGMVA